MSSTVSTANHVPGKASHSVYDITMRTPSFEFGQDIPDFWYDNDPFKSMLLSALSTVFPDGERFFIDAVRNYQPQIQDAALQKAIRLFIGQEAHHGKEHRLMNDFLRDKGYPVAGIEQVVKRGTQMYRKYFSHERQLAQTVALEHFTAIMAEYLLLDPVELDKMHKGMVTLWAWHAVEESEHKAVAFDVFKATVDSEWIRISQMLFCTLMFSTVTAINVTRMLASSGQMRNPKVWRSGFSYILGRNGIVRKILPAYLSFYRPGFHPNQHDNQHKVDAIKQRYLVAVS